MPVLALYSSFGALPSPSVKLVLDCLDEMLTSDNGLGHVIGSLSRVGVHVDLVVVGDFAGSALAGHALSALEKIGEKFVSGKLLGSLLLFLESLLFESVCTSLHVSIINLVGDTLDVPE